MLIIRYKLMKYYFLHVFTALDQLVNAVFCGYPDETLSARSWRCRDKKRWAIMVKVINFLAHNQHHCELAFAKEIDLPEDVYGKSWDKKY